MNLLNEIKMILEKENVTCVIKNQDKVNKYYDTGIKPLLICLKEEKEWMKGSIVADRVIGKAAAFLMVYGKVKEGYTPCISQNALDLFKEYNMKITYDTVVPYIINRTKTDMCPMEQLCLTVKSPEEAYEILSKKVVI